MKRTVGIVVVLAALALMGLAAWFVQPGVPRPGLVSVALAASSCQCPENQCANGKVAGCTVTCPAVEDAECACDGFCDANGNPGGLNRCACQR